MDVTKAPYAEFLEDFIKSLVELQAEKIGVSAILQDGNVLTGYYECDHQDKALMGYHMTSDAMMDVVRANARQIIAAAEEEGAEDGD